MIDTWVRALPVLVGFALVAWAVATAKRNVGLVDIAWPLFFLHVFCHWSTPYAFVDGGPSDWMSRHFFSGGLMPSDDLALRFQDRLRLVERWRWDGRYYEKTANAWLGNVDARRDAALAVLAATYGADEAARWLQRWRIFFMACAELFGYRDGQEWRVVHYLFERRRS